MMWYDAGGKSIGVSFSVHLARRRGLLTKDCTGVRSVSIKRTFGETLFRGVRSRCSVTITSRTCGRCLSDNYGSAPVTRF